METEIDKTIKHTMLQNTKTIGDHIDKYKDTRIIRSFPFYSFKLDI